MFQKKRNSKCPSIDLNSKLTKVYHNSKSTQNCGIVSFGINSQADAGVEEAEAVVAEEAAAVAGAVEAVEVIL